MLVIKFREGTKTIVVAIASDLTLGQSDRAVEISDVTLAQQLVLQHGAERGRDRHRQLERPLVADEPFHHREQWNVALGYRFEEPIFFEKFLMFRMPNERQVRVKDEREI